MRPHLVGIAGGTASGKTTLVRRLLGAAGDRAAGLIELDAYYRCQKHLPFSVREKANYDHPDAFEFELLLKHLSTLRSGTAVRIPVYDFSRHTRDENELRTVEPKQVIFIEGILTLCRAELHSSFDTTVFVYAPEDIRFERRLHRDIRERGRTKESVLLQWKNTVQPMHEAYCEPSRAAADLLVDGTALPDDAISALWRDIIARIEKHP